MFFNVGICIKTCCGPDMTRASRPLGSDLRLMPAWFAEPTYFRACCRRSSLRWTNMRCLSSADLEKRLPRASKSPPSLGSASSSLKSRASSSRGLTSRGTRSVWTRRKQGPREHRLPSWAEPAWPECPNQPVFFWTQERPAARQGPTSACVTAEVGPGGQAATLGLGTTNNRTQLTLDVQCQ